MTGKTLRATLLSAAMLAMTTGMGMLVTPTNDGHAAHIAGALLLTSGAILSFVREQVKETQANVLENDHGNAKAPMM